MNQILVKMMKPLIDTDILRYELGFGFQYKEDDELFMRDYEDLVETFDNKIKFICESVEATEPPILFLTNDSVTHKLLVKRGFKKEFKENFRHKLAKTKVYKGTRKSPKPLHYTNLTAHILDNYPNVIIGNGLEADDEMSIYQTNNKNTIICSRDKDLRICPGLHYSWELGNQAEIGPLDFDKVGWVKFMGEDRSKLFGGGLAFFYSQLITGDVADNIPGIPKGGAVLAEKTLSGCNSEKEFYTAVSELYKERIGEGWEEYMTEQANLLWMVQELDEDEQPIMYKWPTD